MKIKDHPWVGVDNIIVNEEGKVLLIKRSRQERNFPGKWGLVSGWMEWGETVEQALKREAKEEVGVGVEVVKLFGIYDAPGRHPTKSSVALAHLCIIKQGEPKPNQPEEVEKIGWFTPEQIKKMDLGYDHKKMVLDWAKKLKVVEIDHLLDFYKNKAGTYDKSDRCSDVKNDILKTVRRDIDLKNKIILDLGAGTGKFSIPLSKIAKRVYSLDASKEMLGVLKEKIKKKKIKNIKIFNSDFGKISLPDESVDVVFSSWAFPAHSHERDKDFKELNRVLKKDGKMVFIDVYYKGELRRVRATINKNPDKIVKSIHDWILLKGFRHKVIEITEDYGSEKGIKEFYIQFFGKDVGNYLLKRRMFRFKEKISIFYGGKK